jgi:mono/diheme cytochrome c family protein
MRALLFCCLVLLLGGCEQKMTEMPRIDPLAATGLFSDGSGARVPPAGTVATNAALGPERTALPAALDLGLMQRGRERFNIFCSPCHDYTGHGNGRVVQRGFPHPPDFHAARLIAAPDGHFFDVITHGYGAMFSYASRVPPADRWAIIAYIRALQYSEQVPAADLTLEQREKLAETQP